MTFVMVPFVGKYQNLSKLVFDFFVPALAVYEINILNI